MNRFNFFKLFFGVLFLSCNENNIHAYYKNSFNEVAMYQDKYNGDKDFSLSFNFIESENKSKGTIKRDKIDSQVIYSASAKTITIISLGTKSTWHIGKISLSKLNGINTYSTAVEDNGRIIGSISWNFDSVHFLTEGRRISLGNIK